MTHKMMFVDGVGRRVLRDDAIPDNADRYFVPTVVGATEWVENWDEFKAAGGTVCFNGDQTGIELMLPEPYKFSIKFQDNR